MASSGRRRVNNGLLSTAPKFFKIILDPLADFLEIPPEFTKRYGQNLRNRIFLNVPSGSVFGLELVESHGETLLQSGWREFKRHHSIGFGHFLVFQYNGDSQFDVLIFDTSASEINYPVDAFFKADQTPKAKDDETESDDSVVFLGQFSASNRGKGDAENSEDSDENGSEVSLIVLENPSAGQQNRRKRQLCDDAIGFSSPTYHSERRGPRIRMKREELISEECRDGSGTKCSDREQKERSVAKETTVAYQKAVAFSCAHTFLNPFFISLMQPSYVSPKANLGVPLTFAKANLPCKSFNLTMRMTSRKAWSVRCIVREGKTKLSAGWWGFVRDNALKVGDACIFEVDKSIKDFVWNATIFRS